MRLQDILSTLLSRHKSSGHVRGLVARVLLEHAGNGTTERCRLTLRDIAAITGASSEMVNVSIESLCDEGAIRIERHRLIINGELLEKIAFNTN